MIIRVQFSEEYGLVFSIWSIYSVDPQTTLFHLLDDIHSGIYLFFILRTVLPD